ncbi:GNAT family N-acetyltransferase [Streptomyces avermitilis]|uniref:GNAT family N-acetyltransferase n=1 Tax=Streptomyces avermitilis TaxID=33903 RepID=UPI0033B1135D
MTRTVRVLTGATALAFLNGPYSDLYHNDTNATAYQSPDWLGAWAEQLPAAATPMCLVAQVGPGRVEAALALVRDTTDTHSRLYPLSAPMSDYVRATGPHADDLPVAASFAFALTQLAHDGTTVELTDVPAASSLGRSLAQTAGREGWQQHTTQCAEIDLPVDYTAVSPSTRRSHRRRQRRWDSLAENRSVVYRRTRTTAELLAAHDVLTALHQRRWASRTLQPDTPHTTTALGWHTVLERCGADNAFIATLAMDGTVIAAQLCLYRRRTCYSLIPAMDPDHQDLAPGHALLRHLARDLCDHGFRVLDLGRTAEGQHTYKEQYRPRWTSTVSASRVPHLAAA